jgi:RNA polymerase sigma-70 factor (ECF subfamily)
VQRVQFQKSNVQAASNETTCENFAALVPMHMTTMLRVAAALVGVADAEDAAQEALVRGWQAWSSLRDRSAMRAWLLRITVNVCRDWQRGRFGTRQRLVGSLNLGSDADPIALLGSDPGASDHAAALDLRQAVNSLAPDYRLIVVLRYYVGLDASEIGEALAIPAATVRTRLRRALALLRERLSASGETSPSAYWKGDPDA